jgi:Leucine-rich repeat (LRR) protein
MRLTAGKKFANFQSFQGKYEDNEVDGHFATSNLPHNNSLEQINLTGNKIPSITSRNENAFPKLKYLHLNNNLISDWQSIDALDSYNTLEHVRCKDNPVFEGMTGIESHLHRKEHS